MPMPWMALGVDGVAGEAVPQFFQDRGVHLATAVDVDDPESAIAPVNPPAGNRLLRKCDVVLHQPRAGLVSNVQIGDGLATGQANDDGDPYFDADRSGGCAAGLCHFAMGFGGGGGRTRIRGHMRSRISTRA